MYYIFCDFLNVVSSVILFSYHIVIDLLTIFVSEIIGTGTLMFMGCAGGLDWGNGPIPGFLPGLLFGLTVAILVQCFAVVSGAHLNPAVSLAALLSKQITPIVSIMHGLIDEIHKHNI